MENESGALSRVIGLFSQRGYNIESLTVAPSDDPTLSRMTIQTLFRSPPTVNWFPVSPALMKARSPASLSLWSAQRATKSRQARPALTV
ncbi:acetolactate synthase small subunit, partial [Salmonella enterica subsp. enterica serovar Virginia]|nr:acetolactate synthase small subunit [Salmonella enterica subsp. enterica serovar Virginia]